MKFYINNDEYNFSEEELNDTLLSNAGTEGTVYKIGDRAVKIYKPFCLKNRLDESTAKLLSTIKTNRILMPRELVYDSKRNFCGYTTKYIESSNKDNIKRFKMKKLLDEIKLYEEDMVKLSDHNISLCDFDIFNTEYSDGIYFCDPGSFELEDKDNRFFKALNEDEIKSFFIYSIMSRFSDLNKKSSSKLYNHFSYDSYLSDMIKSEDYEENETMVHFVKKLVNKR